MTPEQCRAARAMLRWGQRQLAARAGISTPSVLRFENGGDVRSDFVALMQQALEEAGIDFALGGVLPRGYDREDT